MRIYTSDTNSVLVEKITKEISDKATQNINENYCLIVPEKFSVSMEKLVLKESKSKALMNVQVVTLSRLLYKLLPSTNNYFSSVMGIMATKRVILENYDNLVCYKKTAKTMGFAENIYDTISELKNSKVTPEDYYKKNKTGTSLDIKLHDIFMLYKAYEDYIKKEGLVDASDRFDLLSDAVYSSDYIKNSNVYVFGFDSTTRSGLSVFEAIIKSSKSITVCCLDNTLKANSYVCPPEMLNNFVGIAKELNIKPVIINIEAGKMSVAQAIANNLYAYPYSKMKIDDEVRLFEAKTVIEEISAVAEDIRSKVISKNLRYRDFAIATSGVDEIQDLIKMVFDEYKLPYFIDASQKLAEHPLCGFVEGVLNTIRKNYSQDEMLGVMSNYFSGVSRSDYAIFENYVIKFGVNYDGFKSVFEYKTKDEQDCIVAEAVRKQFIDKCDVIKKIIQKSSTAKAFKNAVVKIFELFEVEKLLGTFEETLLNMGELTAKDVSKQALGKISDLLDGAEKIFGEVKIDFDQYFAVLQSGLASETISVIPVTVDNVFVGDVSTSKFFGVKELYVLGATDGAVPRVKDDCGIIVDKELELISSTIGKKIEPTIKTINQREKFKLINLLQEFSGSLTVSYSFVGRSGDEQRPSSLIRELSKIFYREDLNRGLDIVNISRVKKFRTLMGKDQKNQSYAYEFATETVATKELIKVLGDIKQGRTVDDISQYYDLFNILKGIGTAQTKQIVDEIILNKPEESLKHASKLYFKDGKTSVSQMECYFSCPFKFFSNFGLRLKPRDEALLKSVDYGNILHKIAELYIKNINKYESDKRPIVEKQKDLEAMINYVFSQEKLKTANNKHMLLQLKQEAMRLIDTLTYQYRLSNFKPVAQELVFGKNGKIPSVKLNKSVEVEGKIDRVDMCGDFYRVIDYKTGHIDLSPKAVYYGQKMQLFMYLLAIGSVKDKKPAGAFYLPIRNVFVDENMGNVFSTYKLQGFFNDSPDVIKNMDIRLSPNNPKSDIVNISVSSNKSNRETETIQAIGNNGFAEEELKEISAYTKELCAGAVDEIFSGYTSPRPMEQDGRTPCEFCEFKYACGRDFNSSKNIRKQLPNIKFENIKGGK